MMKWDRQINLQKVQNKVKKLYMLETGNLESTWSKKDYN